MSSKSSNLSSQGQILSYMPQLDALRAFAALAVVVQHFAHGQAITSILSMGFGGVRLFYVLSGFLITAILLRCKNYIEDGEATLAWMARQFYARRFLRIFPVYYLVLLIVFILDAPPVRDSFLWHFFYLSNFFFAGMGTWEGTGAITHFWSLAVEEQFYLIWPWLIFATPKRHILKLILASLLVGPVYRLTGVLLAWNPVAIEALVLGCIDSLGLGALLAYILYRGGFESDGFKKLMRLGLWIGIPSSILVVVSTYLNPDLAWLQVGKQIFFSLLFLWMVGRCAQGVKGPVGKFLEFGPFLYLGKISYGIYLYHFPVLWAYTKFSESYGIELPGGAEGFLFKIVITLVISSISWHLFEAPINRLKSRFQYRPTSLVSPSPVNSK